MKCRRTVHNTNANKTIALEANRDKTYCRHISVALPPVHTSTELTSAIEVEPIAFESVEVQHWVDFDEVIVRADLGSKASCQNVCAGL